LNGIQQRLLKAISGQKIKKIYVALQAFLNDLTKKNILNIYLAFRLMALIIFKLI
jgi:hypothetical protein